MGGSSSTRTPRKTRWQSSRPETPRSSVSPSSSSLPAPSFPSGTSAARQTPAQNSLTCLMTKTRLVSSLPSQAPSLPPPSLTLSQRLGPPPVPPTPFPLLTTQPLPTSSPSPSAKPFSSPRSTTMVGPQVLSRPRARRASSPCLMSRPQLLLPSGKPPPSLSFNSCKYICVRQK